MTQTEKETLVERAARKAMHGFARERGLSIERAVFEHFRGAPARSSATLFTPDGQRVARWSAWWDDERDACVMTGLVDPDWREGEAVYLGVVEQPPEPA